MDPAVLGVMIPIVAIIFGVGIGVVWVIAAHRQRMQRADFRHRERLAAIDKGLELPPDPMDADPNATVRRPRHLLRGLVLLLVGLALTAALGQTGAEGYLFGLIPAAAGLGYLIYYLVEGRHEAARALGAPPPR